MTDVQTRSLRATDREQWEALWADYNAFYGRVGATALSERVIATTWARLLCSGEPVVGAVAEQEGELVGLAHCIFHRNMIQVSDTCYLQDLFTAPSARGFGLAQRLVAKMFAICEEHGVQDMYWHTQTSNSTARRLYDRIATNTDFLVYRVKLHQSVSGGA